MKRNRMRHGLLCLISLLVLSIAFSSEWLRPAPVLADLGWVGDMFPAGGSSNKTTIDGGTSLDVYISAYKVGVTDSPGQGTGISCSLYWGKVSAWGDSWNQVTNTPMTYVGDSGSNDRYRATISPELGLYEFTAYCTDGTPYWQAGGNGQLAVGKCTEAAVGDDTIYWDGLLHDSFSTLYRDPIGPVTTDQVTVTLGLRTCGEDVDGAAVRIWDDFTGVAATTSLTPGSIVTDSVLGKISLWTTDVSIPVSPTIFYYTFVAQDGSATVYYRDDDPKFYGGGYGAAEADQGVAYDNSYQLTVYDPDFAVPSWMQGGVVYQVFPDRFRDGDSANNPSAGRFSYDVAGGAIVRSHTITNVANPAGDWNFTLCDPRDTYTPGCTGKWGDNFYGGDLAGITEKIEAGYFDALGVSVLYLNPIFSSPSNHKYDTSDYMLIDPDFGTLADFEALTEAAHAHGMKVLLDGVFNHTSSDSRYFDRYMRYDADGNLTSAGGVGMDDNSGACESPDAIYRGGFYISDTVSSPATGPEDRCDAADDDDPGGEWDQSYTAWWGYGSLPKLNAGSQLVRDLIWDAALNSVGPYWVSEGADGWRFDVGDDVDPGLTADPANDYWEGFRAAVRDDAVTGKDDVLMLGELWGDASALLLGNEWDSVMNYRFRSALLGWLFTGCAETGDEDGCAGGTLFEDNDNNAGSAGGAISYLSPSLFNARLRSIEEDYPPQAFHAMMNLAGSHDTNRVRFVLTKINNDSDAAALQRMKEWWLFSFTYAGAPALYYGDEVALSRDAVWANGKWEDDPYNRVPYPWPDASGSSYAPVTSTLAFVRKMASVRWSYPALQSGDVQHGIVIDDVNRIYGFARTTGSQTALVLLNRSGSQHTVALSGLNDAPYNLADDTLLYDVIEGNTYTVTGGALGVPVNPSWGVVLLEQDQIQTPVAPPVTYTELVGPDLLSWPVVATDTTGGRELATTYTIHRGSDAGFTPGDGNRIGTLTPPEFGAPGGVLTFTTTNPAAGTYYKVCAYNAAGKSSCGMPSEPTSVAFVETRPERVMGWLTLALALLGAAWIFFRLTAKGQKL